VQARKQKSAARRFITGRGGGIRTHDPLLPNHNPISSTSSSYLVFYSAISKIQPLESLVPQGAFFDSGADFSSKTGILASAMPANDGASFCCWRSCPGDADYYLNGP
jgi:hypothetical protein